MQIKERETADGNAIHKSETENSAFVIERKKLMQEKARKQCAQTSHDKFDTQRHQ